MTTHKNFAAALALLVGAGFAQTLPASADEAEGYDSENTRAICRGSIEDCLRRSSAGQTLGGSASILSRQRYQAAPAPAYQPAAPAYQAQPATAYQQVPVYQPQPATAYQPSYNAAAGGSQSEIQILKQQVNQLQSQMAQILQELRRR